MFNPAVMEGQAYRAWLDYQRLEKMCARLSRLSGRQPVTDSTTLKRLQAPRNTRARVLHERAKVVCAQAQRDALRLAFACFEDLHRIENIAGRSLDIIPFQAGERRRLVLDKAFVVSEPTFSWPHQARTSCMAATLTQTCSRLCCAPTEIQTSST